MTDRATIVVGPVWARIDGPASVVAAASDVLTIFNPAAEHTHAFRNGRWDGTEKFLKKHRNEFLAGLTWKVSWGLVARGFEKPKITWPPAADLEPLAPGLAGLEWREYQLAAVEKAVRARRMCLQCPTRGGKTEIAMEFIRRVGRKTLWLTHTKQLLEQTPERFRTRLGIDPGIVGGPRRTDGIVVVGMVQTLSRLLPESKEFFHQFGCLVIDEAHHAGADTWQAVAQACSSADYRLGLSGTMETGDPIANLKIEGALGPTYTVATTMGLAHLGFLARPRVVLLSAPWTTYPSYAEVREVVCPSWRENPRRLSTLGTSLYREAYDRGVVFNTARNTAAAGAAVRHATAGERFLVLCDRVRHATILAKLIEDLLPKQCSTFFLDGEAGRDKRASTLADFKKARGGAVLVATPFFREGVDAPEIDAGLLAGAGESSVSVLQALGRMLTVRPDKKEVLIYDFLDGHDRGRKDYLANHSRERLALYRKHGFEVT